jgi:magnesium-transporting ATPase (P-type)
MAQVRPWQTGAWVAVTATAGVISWQAAAITVVVVVVSGVLRLLTEWQRRKTLTALMRGAPEGTVVVLSDSPSGSP